MILDPFPLDDSDPLTALKRKPEETLLAYLIRYQWELAGRVRLLAAARDAYIEILDIERARWRRCTILLVLAGPFVAALAYVGLSECGIAGSMPAVFMAGLIAAAGLAGSLMVLGIASVLGRLPTWLIEHVRLGRRQ